MKKILFVIESLGLGGAEKSLVNLLHTLDYKEYEVDLFLMYQKGLFMDLIPNQVRVIPHNSTWMSFQLHLGRALGRLILKGKFKLAFDRLKITLKSRLFKLNQARQQEMWELYRDAIGKVDGEYDVAIGYLEKYSNYFVIDSTSAKKKIGWVHIDYLTYGLNAAYDYPYFEQFYRIASVSEVCIDTLKSIFTNMQEKFVLVENISSPELIKEMAQQEVFQEDAGMKENRITLITTARIIEQKGIDLAILAAELMKKDGYDFQWNILGDGPLRTKMNQLIKEKGLGDNMRIIGPITNPYPYIKAADIYVQTSLFEGKSIAIDEAKILCKPIVATKFPTVYDQLQDNKTAMLAELNPKSIYHNIKFLIDNEDKRLELAHQLSLEKVENKNKLEEFYKMIG